MENFKVISRAHKFFHSTPKDRGKFTQEGRKLISAAKTTNFNEHFLKLIPLLTSRIAKRKKEGNMAIRNALRKKSDVKNKFLHDGKRRKKKILNVEREIFTLLKFSLARVKNKFTLSFFFGNEIEKYKQNKLPVS